MAAALDPIARFRRWFADAARTRIALPEAMALATADRRGRPSVRYVLLKGVDERGFVFFTDARSRKGGELRANPHAALVLHWEPLRRQVRVEGRVVEVSAREADGYWESRPRESRVAASVSRQSAPLDSYPELQVRWRRLLRAVGNDGPLPRPLAWTGFRIVPAAIEFWISGPHRLHRRERFTRARGAWQRALLQP